MKDNTLLALFLGNTHSDTHPAVPATTGALHYRQQFPRTFTVCVTLVSLLIICSVIKQRSSRLRLYSPPQRKDSASRVWKKPSPMSRFSQGLIV